jgi:hypothetical protein
LVGTIATAMEEQQATVNGVNDVAELAPFDHHRVRENHCND